MARKKCKVCEGGGRLHVDPCPFGPNSKVLASECECICGHPAGMSCPACLGTGRRQRHGPSGSAINDIMIIEDQKWLDDIEKYLDSLPTQEELFESMGIPKEFLYPPEGVSDTKAMDSYIENHPVKKALKKAEEDLQETKDIIQECGFSWGGNWHKTED